MLRHAVKTGELHHHLGRDPEVARAVHLSPQAVGGTLAQLLELGMIARSAPAAGRPLDLTITDSGLEALEDAEATTAVLAGRLMSAFRAEHRKFLDGAVRHLLRVSGQLDEPAPGGEGGASIGAVL